MVSLLVKVRTILKCYMLSDLGIFALMGFAFFFFFVLSNCLCMYSWIRNATTIDGKSLNPYFLLATASCVHLFPLLLLATKILLCICLVIW